MHPMLTTASRRPAAQATSSIAARDLDLLT